MARTGEGVRRMTGAVEGGPRVRAYHGSLVLKALMSVVLLVVAGGLTAFAVLLVEAADAPFVVAVPFALFAAVVFALMLGLIRSVTIVGPDDISVRDMGLTRVPWRDVVAIEVEDDRAAGGGKPVVSVVVYDRDGRRTILPNITDTRRMSARREARDIREVWERRRGPDWSPQPTAIDVAKVRSAARVRAEGSILDAMRWGRSAMRLLAFTIFVVALIALATGNAGALPEIPGWALGAVFAGVGLAPLVFVLSAALMGVRDRRRDR